MRIFNIMDYVTRFSYFAKAFSLIVISQGINAIANFVLVSVFTKKLPPSDYGHINLLWLSVLVLSVLVDSRLGTAFCIKLYKVTRAETATNVYTILAYNLAILLLFFTTFSIFPDLLKTIFKVSVDTADVKILFIILMLMVISNFYNNYLIADKKPIEYFVSVCIYNTLITSTSIVMLFVLHMGYRAYFYAYLAGYAAISVIALFHFIRNLKPLNNNYLSYESLQSLLRLGLPLVPDSLLLMFLMWSGRYLLNLNHGLAVVGIFSVAYSFSNIFNSFIVTPFGQALYPTIFRKFHEDIAGYKTMLQSIFKFYWIVMITLMLLYFTFLKEIFTLVVGKSYHDGYNIIAIIVLGIIVWGASNLIMATIIMTEKTAKVFIFTFVAFLINIVFNIVLVPKYDIYGSAIALMIGYMVQFACVLAYTQKLIPINYDYRFMIKTAAFAMFFCGLTIGASYLDFNMTTAVCIKLVIMCGYLYLANKKYEVISKIKFLMRPDAATV